MGYYRDQKILDQFGKRLKAFREAANLSQEQVHYSTRIGQSNIAKMEAGKLNTSLSQIALLSELFGIEDHELLDFKAPVSDAETLQKNISRFLKKRGIDPKIFLKQGITQIIETNLLPTKFLNIPRFSNEISQYCSEKFDADFTTSQISRAMEGFVNRGLIEIIKTDKKSKFQYKKK